MSTVARENEVDKLIYFNFWRLDAMGHNRSIWVTCSWSHNLDCKKSLILANPVKYTRASENRFPRVFLKFRVRACVFARHSITIAKIRA